MADCNINAVRSTGKRICAAAGGLFIYRKKIMQESQAWTLLFDTWKKWRKKLWLEK